ncbi:YlbF family regulator [Fructilactobacillus cliffordii]|uniref:YlbF family regulator n=1 Tax=Fructilactobacillus cliffordii TaxID=2940299 RepID=A0A9Q8ZV14_9LACO|nr:YlbF family regulator [Fructilactobacillus cliffordii]USS86766.1 YlbF family regulator [Fructilactobacillus cliffordii]USS89762.1 YlbF family regulator [Fructilactobacillus cliffordii]
MSDNKIMEQAQKMQEAVVKSEEFTNLKNAFEALKNEKESYKVFTDFQKNQSDLRQKQMAGQEITPDDMKYARELADKMNDLPAIKVLMEREKAMGKLIDDANMVITEPLRQLYEG